MRLFHALGSIWRCWKYETEQERERIRNEAWAEARLDRIEAREREARRQEIREASREAYEQFVAEREALRNTQQEGAA